MQSQTISFHKKNVYGVEKLYITDEKKAGTFYKLTGRKTLNTKDIEVLKEFNINCVHTPIN